MNAGYESFISVNSSVSTDYLREALVAGPLDGGGLVDRYQVNRRCLKGFQMAVSLGANVSYFPIILRAGAHYAVGNFLSFVALDFWAIRATLEDAFGAVTEEEAALLERAAMGRCYAVGLGAASVALAIFAETPLALPALDYDGMMKVPAMVVVYLGGSILSLRSIQMSINELIKRRLGGDECEKVMRSVQKQMVSVMGQFQKHFKRFSMEQKLGVLSHFQAIRRREDIDRVNEVLALMTAQEEVGEGQCKKFMHELGDKVGYLAGIWLASSLETALTLYTFDKSKKYVTDDDGWAAAMTAVCIVCGLFLTGKAIVGTAHRFSSAFFRGLLGENESDIGDQLRPLLSGSLKLLGLVLNLGVFGSSFVVFGDFFQDNEFEKEYFEATGCAAYFLLVSTATLDLIEEVVQAIILKGEEGRDVVRLYHDLGKMKQLVEKSSLLDFCVFLSRCPEGVKQRILQKVNGSHQALSEYLGRAAES